MRWLLPSQDGEVGPVELHGEKGKAFLVPTRSNETRAVRATLTMVRTKQDEALSP